MATLASACGGQADRTGQAPTATTQPTTAAQRSTSQPTALPAEPTGVATAAPSPAAPSPTALATATATAARSRPRPTVNTATARPTRAATTPPTALPAKPAAPTATRTAAPFNAQHVTLELQEFANGLQNPLFVTYSGDGGNDLFVVEKGGTIRLLPGKQIFLDISDRVGADGSEQGLLGLAFHPRFLDNGYFYVDYTDQNGDTVVSRFTAGPDRRSASPDSESTLLQQDQPAANHNGGMLAFGPDGYLYIGFGDGGGADDTYGNGQRKDTFLGKILRIGVASEEKYSVPPDNPFVNDQSFRPEIWAYGLRNPWRFSFDRRTGDLYIADVGQNQYEEVDVQPAGSHEGRNYGWSIVEGNGHCLSGDTCDTAGLTPPVTEYEHDQGCSITGGYVYRGKRYPMLEGAYIFGDYCSGQVWTLARDAGGRWVKTETLKTDTSISSFGEDSAGEIYLTDLDNGIVYRVVARAR